MKNLCMFLVVTCVLCIRTVQAQTHDFTVNFNALPSTKEMLLTKAQLGKLTRSEKMSLVITHTGTAQLALTDGTVFKKEGTTQVLDMTPILQNGLARQQAIIEVKDISEAGRGKVVGTLTFRYGNRADDTPTRVRASGNERNGEGTPLTNTILTLDMCPSSHRLTIAEEDGRQRNKLYVRHNEVIELRVVNTNPFRYTLELDNSPVAFNTDGTGLDTLLAKGSVPSASGIEEATAEQKIQQVERLIASADAMTNEITGYKSAMAARMCINSEEAGEAILSFYSRVTTLAGGTTNLATLASQKLTGLDAAAPTLEKLKSSAVQQSLQTLEQALASLKGLDFETYTFPYQVSGKNIDLLRFGITQRPIPASGQSQSVVYDVYLRGGIKIDFSAGIFLSGLTDHSFVIQDDSVRLTANQPRTAGKVLIQENGSSSTFAFGSLMHVYPRLGLINPSISWGIALTSQQRFQLLLGGGLLVGREQRFAVNGGITWGQVKKRLSAVYKTDLDGRLYADGTATTVSLVDKMERSWFVGITYNLTRTKVAGGEK